MVQKTRQPPSAAKADGGNIEGPTAPKRRGRPRGYAPDGARGRALDLFRNNGFAATSLDDLSAATGMNRPSLYGAFGDKRELYKKSYENYRNRARARMGEVFGTDLPLRPMLERIYAIALDMYLSGEDGPRGCFTVMTATSEAMADQEIRSLVQRALGSTQRTLAKRFQTAVETGELPPTANVQILSQIAASTVEALAIRARARVPRGDLEAMAKGTVDLICGLPKAAN
jgi:AcrR family transcriptional regulator